MRRPDSLEQELRGFSNRVQALGDAGQPVKIQVGFGWSPAPGFVNLEVVPHLAESDHRFDHVDVFYFPYADMPWPIPDNSVDFIFHEDFIEHISKRGKTVGGRALFSCRDSARPSLYVMCHRHRPFPR